MQTWLPFDLCALVESYLTYCQLYYFRTGDLGIVIHEPLGFEWQLVKPLVDHSSISHAKYLAYCIHNDIEWEVVRYWDDKYASQLLFNMALSKGNWNVIKLFGKVDRHYEFEYLTKQDINRLYAMDRREPMDKIRYWQYLAIRLNRLDILQLTGPFDIAFVFEFGLARGVNESTLDYIYALCTSDNQRKEIVNLAAFYSKQFNWCMKHGFEMQGKKIKYSMEYLTYLKPGFVMDVNEFFSMNREEALFFKQKFGCGQNLQLAYDFRNVSNVIFWEISNAAFFVNECYLRPSQYFIHTDTWTNEEIATVLNDPTHVLYESLSKIVWYVSTDKHALMWIMTHLDQLPRISPFRKHDILLALHDNVEWHKRWQAMIPDISK